MRQTADIQYAPVPPPPPPQDPAWLKTLAEALKAFFEPVGRAIGRSWPLIEMLLVALAAVAAAWLAWLLLARLARYRYCSPKAETWAPSQNQALALLEEADRLAAEGRFDDATHLLLQRSVVHIAEDRPGSLYPATTAREIALLPGLPGAARDAFGLIAQRVERCMFALVPLGPEDWQAARSAYARFAVTDLNG
ncbi:MAG: hypothetical protein V4579_10630 [Pseudomonadota bacterium]